MCVNSISEKCIGIIIIVLAFNFRYGSGIGQNKFVATGQVGFPLAPECEVVNCPVDVDLAGGFPNFRRTKS
jgi:hypothetical protein